MTVITGIHQRYAPRMYLLLNIYPLTLSHYICNLLKNLSNYKAVNILMKVGLSIEMGEHNNYKKAKLRPY